MPRAAAPETECGASRPELRARPRQVRRGWRPGIRGGRCTRAVVAFDHPPEHSGNGRSKSVTRTSNRLHRGTHRSRTHHRSSSTMAKTQKKLGEILVEWGIISAKEVNKALDHAKAKNL